MPVPSPGADWRLRARCRNEDPEIFFPAGDPPDPFDERNTEALTVCARCPVVAECLAEALVRIPFGIAGGMTARERAELRIARQRARPRPNQSAPTATAGPDALHAHDSRAGVRARGVELLRAGTPWGKIAEQCDVSYRSVERWAAAHAVPPPSRRARERASARQIA